MIFFLSKKFNLDIFDESGKLLVGDEHFASEETKTGIRGVKTNKGKKLDRTCCI